MLLGISALASAEKSIPSQLQDPTHSHRTGIRGVGLLQGGGFPPNPETIAAADDSRVLTSARHGWEGRRRGAGDTAVDDGYSDALLTCAPDQIRMLEEGAVVVEDFVVVWPKPVLAGEDGESGDGGADGGYVFRMIILGTVSSRSNNYFSLR